MWRILDDKDIKPHKIRDYLEKRAPEFDRKIQKVPMVYRDISLYPEDAIIAVVLDNPSAHISQETMAYQ